MDNLGPQSRSHFRRQRHRARSSSGAQTCLPTARSPVQSLGQLEARSLEAAFILKDFHRDMEASCGRPPPARCGTKIFRRIGRTVIMTAPSITIAAELGSLVEDLELPLPDSERLAPDHRREHLKRSHTYSLKLKLDADGIEAMAGQSCAD